MNKETFEDFLPLDTWVKLKNEELERNGRCLWVYIPSNSIIRKEILDIPGQPIILTPEEAEKVWPKIKCRRKYMNFDDIWKFRGWLYAILIGFLIVVAVYKYSTREEPVRPPFINAQGWPPDLVPHPHIPEPEKPDFPPPGFPNARTSNWC